MKRRVTCWLFTLCFSLVLCGVALAQDQAAPLTLEKIEVVAYKTINVAEFGSKFGVGPVEVIQGGDEYVFLSVDAYIASPWTEQVESVEVDAENILLLTEAGQSIPMVGYFERYGEFEAWSHYFSEYRPWDWDTNPRPVVYNAVFMVPRDAGAGVLTFKMGDMEAPITGTVTVKTETPDPAELVTVEVLGAKFVDSVTRVTNVGDTEIKSLVTNPEGKILEVKVKVTPSRSNVPSGDYFFWFSDWIAIVCDNGYTGMNIGEHFMDGLTSGVSHNLNQDDNGVWGSDEVDFYFAVPADTNTFTLHFGATAVAQGAVAQ